MNFVGKLRPSSAKLCVLAVVLAASQAGQSFGAMVLQAPFSSQFTLNTFASGFAFPTGGGTGAVGVTFDSTHVYVSQLFVGGGDGKNFFVFPSRALGQTVASSGSLTTSAGVITASFGNQSTDGLANWNGHIFMASEGFQNLGEITLPGGAVSHRVGPSPIPGITAAVASNVRGKVYVNIGSTDVNSSPLPPQILEYDGASLIPPNPILSRNFASFNGTANIAVDSMALSGDQNTLYVLWNNGHIFGYSTAPGTGYAAETVDITASLAGGVLPANIYGGKTGLIAGTGAFEGMLFLNGNDGSLYEINPAAAVQANRLTAIATGGSIGQFMATDPLTGDMYITQSDSVLVLHSTNANAGFASTAIPGAAPEPASLGLLGLSGMALLRRRRQA